MSRQRIALLGATGSIGHSALRVIQKNPDRFELVAVTARRSRDPLAKIVSEWNPSCAVLTDSECPGGTGGTEWRQGADAIIDLVRRDDVDVVINALVGAAGLEPTVAALEAGKRVALANKESLVCGGPLVLDAAKRGGGSLVPVDSEHSAILQCIQGEHPSSISRMILTASGGPFREFSSAQLRSVRPEAALKHPTWDMGAKITIDSATLVNKALEVIEAHFLFEIGYDRLEAVVHPQSIIHSMVEFVDGSVLAQMGFPTMELPILYALGFPDRLPDQPRTFNPVEAGPLSFEDIRENDFPAFRLGVDAGRAGRTYPAVFNAANEVAVEAFLNHRISFPDIAAAISTALDGWKGSEIRQLADILEADRWARATAEDFFERVA